MIAALAARRAGAADHREGEYRDPTRLWVAYNVDRCTRPASRCGWPRTRHEPRKLVLLYGQGMSIFGSSNWTCPSANSQHEHNYFTVKPWIFNWFLDQFERKWNNPTGAPRDRTVRSPAAGQAGISCRPTARPASRSPARSCNGTADRGRTSTTSTSARRRIRRCSRRTRTSDRDPTVPHPVSEIRAAALTAGTTYYWKIVSKTMAGLTADGPIWSFTTTAARRRHAPAATTVVLWTANVVSADITATGSC